MQFEWNIATVNFKMGIPFAIIVFKVSSQNFKSYCHMSFSDIPISSVSAKFTFLLSKMPTI